MHITVVKEVKQLLEQAVAQARLWPEWSGGAARARREAARLAVPAEALDKLERLLGDARRLAEQPVQSWDAELLRAWHVGLVYLRDDEARISPLAELIATNLVIRGSSVASFSSVIGDQVLLEGSAIDRHSVIEGPIAVVKSRLAPQVAVGPYVVLIESGIAHFAKVQRFVRVEKSLIGSNSCIEGGTHPEKMPLGPLHRRLGVIIGRDCWIGQQVSMTAGAALGAGVVVAAHTSITGPVPELVLVAGTPARHLPIDANIRSLTAVEARDEGRLQGLMALELPVFGPWLAGLASERTLEIDYPEHGCLRGLASENLLRFQEGVLETVFAQLFPDYRTEIACRVGRSVRFAVHFDRALVDHVAPRPELLIRPCRTTAAADLQPAEQALLERLGDGARLATIAGSDRESLQALAVRRHVAPALFRRGAHAGMITPNPEPPQLEGLWRRLMGGSTGPLTPFEEAVSTPAPPAQPEPALPEPGLLDAVTDTVRDLLSISREVAVDVDVPFHRLGLDSLMLAELAARLEVRFQIDALDIFSRRTLRSLAELALLKRPRG